MLLLLVLVALASGFSSLARAQGSSRLSALNRARYVFTHGDYEDAVVELRRLLYPLRLEGDDAIVEARKLLGVACFLTGRPDEARAEFEKLLYLRPNYALDPFLFAPPVVEFFDEVRESLMDKLKEIARRQVEQQAAASKPAPPPRQIVERVRVRDPLLCVLPFGAGQFQNGEYGLGWALLGGQVAMLATNILAYHSHLMLADEHGVIPTEKHDTATALLAVQYTALGLFGALWGIGVIQSFAAFEEVSVIPPAAAEAPAMAGPAAQ